MSQCTIPRWIQLRRPKEAGIGGEGKRSRNSDRKWTRAFLGKHEQAESHSSTKRNWTSGFLALERHRTEWSVKVLWIFPASRARKVYILVKCELILVEKLFKIQYTSNLSIFFTLSNSLKLSGNPKLKCLRDRLKEKREVILLLVHKANLRLLVKGLRTCLAFLNETSLRYQKRLKNPSFRGQKILRSDKGRSSKWLKIYPRK